MKLLHIIGSMDPIMGGPCQGIRNLNTALAGKKIHREVVSMDDPQSSFLGSDSFVVHALGPSKSAWQYSPKLLPWLIENLNRFDIVIVNGLWLYHLYATIKALKLLKTKKISIGDYPNKIPKLYIMPHGMLDPYFQKAPDRKLKAFRNWIYWNLIEGKNIKEASGLLFTNEAELQLARQTFRAYKPKREINVGYGIEDAPLFTSEMKTTFLEKCPNLDDSPYLLFLSRIHPKKGVDMLINAYIELSKSRPIQKKNFPKLVIAGPGIETTYGKNLQQLLLKFPEVQSSVFFPGMLTGKAKWGALYGCEAFVLPSHQENFGIAVVEALACSKPVLISNQVNIWREIKAAGGGIVEDDSQKGTTTMLETWGYLSYKEKALINDRARKCFENKFSIGPAATRFMEALQNN